ncbi:aldo/keto reductase [Egicoccus halophilus]|uniref:Aldo/keto reductase n=1 Tax=Egicoccus halophilus TaxID=1670830 RepID=A0A8J3AA60_9ACTN|nr:aldo/keto reductase [Egicoccus halophilus]GGI02415.1 aldo/keto reductase [Egicoccus halophilus]
MSDLPRRMLGNTGVEISALGFGAMELRGEPKGRPVDERHVGRLLNQTLDLGIDLIDTSIDYGVAEERIGRHLAARRDEFFLATKCGCPHDADPATAGGGTPHDYGAANIEAGVEQSLRRMRTDHLDLLQVHMSPSVAELEAAATIKTLQRLRAAGKIRFLGMSGELPHLADHIALGVFDVFQVPYSVLEPEHEPLIARAAEEGAGIVVRGAVAMGAVAPTGPGRRGQALLPIWEQAELDELADGMDRTEFLLRATIGLPGLSTAIIGTLNDDHLVANAEAAARGPLPDDVRREAVRRALEVRE